MEEDEELTLDKSAYHMYHAAQTGAPCLRCVSVPPALSRRLLLNTLIITFSRGRPKTLSSILHHHYLPVTQLLLIWTTNFLDIFFIKQCNITAKTATLTHNPVNFYLSFSFDVIRDSLGEERTTYPMTCSLVCGTQAESSQQNSLILMNMSALSR